MAVEIERKFLLRSDEWRSMVVSSVRMRQGYIVQTGATVRVRICNGDTAVLTIKGGSADGISRREYEYSIPVTDAEEMLAELSVGTVVEKIRSTVPAGNGLIWEIDEYLGANAPLFTAEIELPSADAEFEKPIWLGEEISSNKAFSNRALSVIPYSLRFTGSPAAEDK